MAKIYNQGSFAKVELTNTDTGQVRANCDGHSLGHGEQFDGPACDWSEVYDEWNDATEYSTDHADGAR